MYAFAYVPFSDAFIPLTFQNSSYTFTYASSSFWILFLSRFRLVACISIDYHGKSTATTMVSAFDRVIFSSSSILLGRKPNMTHDYHSHWNGYLEHMKIRKRKTMARCYYHFQFCGFLLKDEGLLSLLSFLLASTKFVCDCLPASIFKNDDLFPGNMLWAFALKKEMRTEKSLRLALFIQERLVLCVVNFFFDIMSRNIFSFTCYLGANM